MDKTDARTLPIEALNERRRRAVKMRLDGIGVDETARRCELARGTVIAAHKAYRRGGWPAVEVARSGRPAGSGRRLCAAQEASVRRLVCAHTPDQLGLDCALWSRAAVAELIRVRCGIALPVRTMGLYLARWGLTPQKPLRRATEQSPEVVKRWLRHDYPAIAARARAEGAEIYWGDETGLRSDDVRARSYAPAGQTPVIRVSHRREALGVICSLTNRGTMRWKILDGALNAAQLVDFMGRLVKDAPAKVFLILDNLKVHHARPVKAWLAPRTEQIEVFYLPSYSPELNPEEVFNADLKRTVTARAPMRYPKAHCARLSSVVCAGCKSCPSASGATSRTRRSAMPLEFIALMPDQ